MRRCLALLIAVVALQTPGLSTGAQAQEKEIDCSAFVKNPDGSWTVIKKVFIPVQNVRVVEGTVFRPGGTFLGDDMAARLNKACPNQPAAVTEPAATPPTQTPLLPLSTYADANGNIDIQRLSCAHLNLTSTQEADLLVTWYSGWYGGIARRRGINLARVQYAIRNVFDYCKANPNRSLVQAMELLMK